MGVRISNMCKLAITFMAIFCIFNVMVGCERKAPTETGKTKEMKVAPEKKAAEAGKKIMEGGKGLIKGAAKKAKEGGQKAIEAGKKIIENGQGEN